MNEAFVELLNDRQRIDAEYFEKLRESLSVLLFFGYYRAVMKWEKRRDKVLRQLKETTC